MGSRIKLLSIAALLMAMLASTAAAQDDPPVNDVRIVIDVSGSMKNNDPDNLRKPALKLITQLLPEGSQASVWTFGQYANMLVKQGDVDQQWKDRAYKAADEIHSLGLFTNIETVLEKATWDWAQPDEGERRNVIFLTDGLVDVSKNSAQSEASRDRILKKLLPRLRDAGVIINTIALSDDADKGFLKQLAATTKGWHEDVRNAEQLERVFLKLFDKAVPTESVPLVDNTLRVDSSVRELTLLIFRDAQARESAIVLPSGQRFTERDAPPNVRWRRERSYDLVTVESPVSGQWKIDAEVDPDNRVMVVTDLRVRATRLPNVMLAEDAKPYYVELLQDRNVIQNQLFLDLVNIKLERQQHGQAQKSINVLDDGRGVDRHDGDGKFSAQVGEAGLHGEYEYHMLVDGGTFARASRQAVRFVDAPATADARKVSDGNPAHYSISVVPYAEIVDPESLVIDAMLAKAAVGSMAVDIPRVGPTEWRLDLNVKAGEEFELSLKVEATKHGGGAVQADLGTFVLGNDHAGPKEPEPHHTPASHDAHSAPVADHHISMPTSGQDSQAAVPGSHHAPPPHDVPSRDDHSDRDHTPQHSPPDEHHAPAHDDHGDDAQHHDDSHDAHGDDHEDAAGEDEQSPNWLMVALKVVGFNGLLIGAGFFVYRRWFSGSASSDDEKSGESKEEAS